MIANILRLIAIVFISAFIIAAASFLGGRYWVLDQLQKPITLPAGTSIAGLRYDVKIGSNLTTLSNDLAHRGIIRSPYLYRLALKLDLIHADIKAGEYQINAALTQGALLELFQSGSNVQYYLTVPEGLTSYEIVQFLNAQEDLKGKIDTMPVEGSLLPETYAYVRGTTRSSVLERMSSAMHAALDQEWDMREQGLTFATKEEALILASIVEKETALPSERTRVAGVFVNRLRKGIKLQTDPTVIYALTLGKHENEGKGPLGRRLLRKDLTYDSPYNTYVYPGLPPAPIANPGRESIAAVLHPERHDYIYFVADGSGGHAFSKTLKEHNARANEWRHLRSSK